MIKTKIKIKIKPEDFREKFIYYFEKYNIGFNCSENMIGEFYRFTEYLLAENAKYNITSITDIDEVIVKHYIDSVIVLKYSGIPENAKIIDIGSGAGFPGVPLAIMRPDLNITFLDSSNKKIGFIRNARGESGEAAGGIYNFIAGRAEEAGRDVNRRESYDLAVSRAVARLNILCELAAPLIKPGGYFIAYKGRAANEEITEAANALKALDLEIESVIEFDLNAGHGKRVLIRIKKTKNTSSKYPRNFSNITKNPL
jgi:16S rRNA (guanine527-N7)-methyltransferase